MNLQDTKNKLAKWGIGLRPILFSTPMVQAIIDGTKTQTRRLLDKQPTDNGVPIIEHHVFGFVQEKQIHQSSFGHKIIQHWGRPYGKIGDILWVRETFSEWTTGVFQYKASTKLEFEPNSWGPSIHMPFEAARIFLRIKSIAVERLNDISEDDAKSEGVEKEDIQNIWKHYSPELSFSKEELKEGFPYTHNAKSSFRTLWKSINGPDSWDANPWVWVIEFEKIILSEFLQQNCPF